jgi:hypothetical protein
MGNTSDLCGRGPFDEGLLPEGREGPQWTFYATVFQPPRYE